MNGLRMLEQVLRTKSGPFALLHRPEVFGANRLEILIGETRAVPRLADIPLTRRAGKAIHESLVLVPHQQIAERGFAAVEDGSQIIVMSITEQGQLTMSQALNLLPDEPINLADGGFDIDDDAYADLVKVILENEIGVGEGSNFVMKRSFVATITNYTVRSALSLFRRLVTQETGAYWTFLVYTGDRTFVGATPERHASLQGGVVVMNPISGTYRYPPDGPVLSEILNFLEDRKEIDELYMVLDEELKMMARICDGGGRVVGPFLREMANLMHTEYYIEGRSNLDPRDILRETMFAPTVTGSPLEKACQVIARYEPYGREYYGGVVALIGHDADGTRTMDSAILIRTADIHGSALDKHAQVKIGVGATLVRHSDAVSEVSETHSKVAGVLAALGASEITETNSKTVNSLSLRFSEFPQVQDALERRNAKIASFWFSDAVLRNTQLPLLNGYCALIIDAEDTFTAMLACQLRAIGLKVQVTRFDAPYNLNDHDLVVLGPGPGDPRNASEPKMAHISSVIEHLLPRHMPFLAVCLSHQLLSRHLGLELVRLDVPNQGTQREIDFFSTPKRVGFYNSYVARCRSSQFECPGIGRVRVCRDIDTSEVYALSGLHFSSVQFHIESVLTQEGIGILTKLLTPLLPSKEVLSA